MSTDIRLEKIKKILLDSFEISRLEIENDSSKHSRPGNDTHYRVLVVSEDFKGLSKVKRHQSVYSACQILFDEGLHSMSLQIFSLSEDKGQVLLDPSLCASKK